MISSMDGTSMVATLVRVAIVANHAIYNYGEGSTVTDSLNEASTMSYLMILSALMTLLSCMLAFLTSLNLVRLLQT